MDYKTTLLKVLSASVDQMLSKDYAPVVIIGFNALGHVYMIPMPNEKMEALPIEVIEAVLLNQFNKGSANQVDVVTVELNKPFGSGEN